MNPGRTQPIHSRFRARINRSRGLTIIEMIGVLAVVAILAALLIPKVFEAISNARLNQTVLEIHATKTAVAEHYAKFGALASSNGAPLAFTGELTAFDQILLGEGLIDKPFRTKLTANASVRLVGVSGYTTATEIERDNAAYDLDGDGNNDVVGGSHAVDVVLVSLTELEALTLNHLLDGPALGTNPGGNDTRGRVRYYQPNSGSNGLGTGLEDAQGNAYAYGHYRDDGTTLRVQIYLTHR